MDAFLLIVFMIGLIVLVPIYHQPLMRVLLRRPIRRLGLTLRNAIVEIHDCQPSTRPDRSEEWEFLSNSDEEISELDRNAAEEDRSDQAESDQRRRWFLLELTISPNKPPDEAFEEWLPCELALVPRDSEYNEGDPLPSVCEVAEVSLWREETWKIDDFSEFRGPQKLQLLIGTEPEERSLTFQYFYERFGQVELPT
ncbi:MAG: hypothetical protein CMJ78_05380 [Planctomycetaceae bacterium]|nr:hypothetical protein [Planctomycetaceae bacterium]